MGAEWFIISTQKQKKALEPTGKMYNRLIDFLKNNKTIASLLFFVGGFWYFNKSKNKNMADTNIPMTQRAFYKKAQIVGNRKALDSLMSRYGNEFTQAANNSNIRLWALQALVLVENLQGNTTANNGGTIGLGQLLPAGIQDIIIMENRERKLTLPEKAVLRATMGDRLDTLLKYKLLGSKQQITAKDLQNPAFNLQCAAIFMSRLIDECTFDGVLRYDQVIVGYNIGYFSGLRKKIKDLDTDEIIATINPITGDYIEKFVGLYGHAQMILAS